MFLIACTKDTQLVFMTFMDRDRQSTLYLSSLPNSLRLNVIHNLICIAQHMYSMLEREHENTLKIVPVHIGYINAYTNAIYSE